MRARDVDLGRAADGEPRVEPVRAELHRPARQRPRYASRAEGFRPTTSRERVYLCGAVGRHEMTEPDALRHCSLSFARLRGTWRSRAVGRGLAACEGCRSTSAPSAHGAAGATSAPPTVRLYLVTDLAGALEPCGCTKDQLGGIDHFGAWVKRRAAAGARGAGGRRRAPLLHGRAARRRARRPGPHQGGDDRAGAPRPRLRRVRPGRQRLGRRARRPREARRRRRGGGAIAWQPATRARHAIVREVGGVKVGFVGFGQPGAPAPRGADVEDAVAPRGRRRRSARGPRCSSPSPRSAAARPSASPTPCPSSRRSSSARPKSERRREHDRAAGRAVGDVLDRADGQPPAERRGARPLRPRARRARARRPVRRRHGPRARRSKREDARAPHRRAAREDRRMGARPERAPGRRRRAPAASSPTLEAQRDALDDEARRPRRGASSATRVKEIRESLGKDPAIEADMLAYYKAVDDHNRVAFADRVPPPPAAATRRATSASTSCIDVPPGAARRSGTRHRHAHAYATLVDAVQGVQPRVRRAATSPATSSPGGSTVTHVDRLKDVQCEVCHGPGSQARRRPRPTRRSSSRKPEPSACLECHHPPHVEGSIRSRR